MAPGAHRHVCHVCSPVRCSPQSAGFTEHLLGAFSARFPELQNQKSKSEGDDLPQGQDDLLGACKTY